MFSPLVLGTILLAARFGARGQTAAQIDNALQLPMTNDNLIELVPIRTGFFKTLKRIGVNS